MKPYIFIFKMPDKNGKFIFTEDELKKVLEKVYNDAYTEGLKAGNSWWNTPITYTSTGTNFTPPPTYKTTTPNDVPNPYQVTCSEAMNTVGD